MKSIRSWLWVGKYRETLDEESLITSKIGAVLQLAASIASTRIQALYLPVDDGIPIPEQDIQHGVAFVLQAKASGLRDMLWGRRLIGWCNGGRSSFRVSRMNCVSQPTSIFPQIRQTLISR